MWLDDYFGIDLRHNWPRSLSQEAPCICSAAPGAKIFSGAEVGGKKNSGVVGAVILTFLNARFRSLKY